MGSHLVTQLLEAGYYVRAFDRFSRDVQFIESDNVEIFKGDISSDEDMNKALDGIHYVIHAFSATTPFTSDNDPYKDISDNLTRSIEIFEMCVKNKIEKISFISSGGAVYGIAAENGLVDETTMPLPVSPYGINKLSIEHYLEYFKRKHGLDYVVYRLTNPYGPGQRSNKNQGVIPTFLEKINNSEQITIFGDGTATRDYIYMGDAARMIVQTFNEPNKYAIYNIGSGNQTSLKQILEIINNTLNRSDIEVNYVPAPLTFLNKTQVNVARFKQEFGDFDLTDIETGIKSTIENS